MTQTKTHPKSYPQTGVRTNQTENTPKPKPEPIREGCCCCHFKPSTSVNVCRLLFCSVCSCLFASVSCFPFSFCLSLCLPIYLPVALSLFLFLLSLSLSIYCPALSSPSEMLWLIRIFVEQCQLVDFVADDLGFVGQRILDLVTELCPPQDTALMLREVIKKKA